VGCGGWASCSGPVEQHCQNALCASKPCCLLQQPQRWAAPGGAQGRRTPAGTVSGGTVSGGTIRTWTKGTGLESESIAVEDSQAVIAGAPPTLEGRIWVQHAGSCLSAAAVVLQVSGCCNSVAPSATAATRHAHEGRLSSGFRTHLACSGAGWRRPLAAAAALGLLVMLRHPAAAASCVLLLPLPACRL
jgi:hypothetical protein